ncbi:MAG: 2-C-methyl-D-erythritol 4-phosphate cytidylyltransferase [Candidatus Omnitrophota bacterium]
MKKRVVAIILAAGSGIRMRADKPKQFMELAGKPVLMHAVEPFAKNILITDIVIVCEKGRVKDTEKLMGDCCPGKTCRIVPGGRTRQESSYNGVKSCPPETEIVIIHDAARPFVDAKTVENVLAAAEKNGAAGAVVKTADTIIVKKGDFIDDIPDRKKTGRMQTPQGFRYGTILRAHEEALKNGMTNATDDCGLVLAMGQNVRIVEGDPLNIKLTDKTDFLFAEELIRSGEVKRS